MSEGARLTRGGIRGHLVTQTLPMTIGVAAIMSIGVVDSYFIGQLGKNHLAAISFIFPIGVALSSLGVGISVGINSIVARALGEGDRARASRRGNFGVVFAAVMGLGLALLLLAVLDPLFALMQADPSLLPLIRAYMVPYALGFPILLVIMGLNGVLRGQGEARKTSYISLCYAAANWVLDPLLITGAFGFDGFGMAGAAYASVIGWAIGMLFAFYLLNRTELPFRPSEVRECQMGESLKAIGSVAAPAAFSNAINPIGLSILTALVASQGQDAVAGFGAAGRLQSFAVVPLLALSGAIGAIVGQNWGAGQADRSREAMVWASGFCIAYGLLLALILSAAGEWFAAFFTQSPGVIREFASYLSIAAWGYAGYGLLIVSNGALNAVGKAQWALLQSFGRVFLIMLPVALILLPHWGSSAIYSAELSANLVGGTVALAIVWHILRKR